jgi:hypothetical protein
MIGYEVYHHPQFLLTGLHSIGCKCKLINLNHCDLRVYKQDPHFLWPRSVLYVFSVRRNFVVCPQESLLKLGVSWVKSLQNTDVVHWNARDISQIPS